MKSWVEAVLAIGITAVVGVSLFLFSGESLGDETTDATMAVSVDSNSIVRGEILAGDAGCLACHTIDGTPNTGPTFKGVYLSSRPLDSGESVTADDVYLFRSITDPVLQIVAGFDNVMPSTYQDTLSDQDISDLVEYIKSLG